MNDKIVICICTRNRAERLKLCIESIRDINYTNLAICVVDNNSNDTTRNVVEAFKDVVYILESHIGVGYARNAFLDYCENLSEDIDYIAFIDDDETVGLNWVNSMLDCFKSDENIAVVVGPYIPVYYEGKPPSWIPDGIHNIYENNKEYNKTYKKFSVVTGNCMVRYDVIKISGIRFNEELGRVGDKVLGGEDTEFFDRLVKGKYLYGYTYNAPIYHYIENNRLTFKYFTKRFFYQGVSEYLIKGYKRALINIPKMIGQTLRLCFVVLTFNKNKIVNNFFKLTKTVGVISGVMIASKK